MIGGTWGVKDACLRQDDAGNADPKKALIVLPDAGDMSSDLVVTAKLRIDSWKNGKDSRAGISICTNPKDGRGLNLVLQEGKLRWLHDFVSWGPSCDFSWQPGQWYWIKLCRLAGERKERPWIDEGGEPAVLKGKAWIDGQEGRQLG